MLLAPWRRNCCAWAGATARGVQENRGQEAPACGLYFAVLRLPYGRQSFHSLDLLLRACTAANNGLLPLSYMSP